MLRKISLLCLPLIVILTAFTIIRSEEPALPNYLQKGLDEFIRKLGDEDWPTREKATTEILAIGPRALPAVEKAMQHADPEIKMRATRLKLLLRWQEAFDKRTDPFINQIRQGNIQDASILSQITQFLGGGDSIYMLIDILKDPQQDKTSRQKVAETFRNASVNLKPILADLIALWKNEPDPVVKYNLMESFARAGRDDQLLPILKDCLTGSDYNSRIIAIRLLGQFHEESVLPDFFKLLRDPDANLRNAVAYALNNFRTPQVFEKLLEAWKGETTPWLRTQMISILGSFQDKRLLAELAQLVKTEKDQQVLDNIIYALQNFPGDPTTSAILINLLRSEAINTRANALRVIRQHRDRTAIPQIVQMLEKESDFDAFTSLLGSLQELAGQRFIPKEIPADLKQTILNTCRQWWEKNK